MQRLPSLIALFLSLLVSTGMHAESIRVAVAANFYTTMKQLSDSYSNDYQANVEVISGSSGKLATQIIQGAPFDLFLSADTERPQYLEEKQRVVDGYRQAYAYGQLALVSLSSNPLDQLLSGQYDKVSMANPAIAPYGTAAEAFLSSRDIEPKAVVYGENVAQAFHYLMTGNVDLAFVSLSQVLDQNILENRYYRIEPSQYPLIEQQMVLISDTTEAKKLYSYLLSDTAKALIEDSGYQVP